MKFNGWKNTPTSKPLAAGAALLTVIVVLFYTFIIEEIPASVKDMLIWFDTLTIGGYLGKSTIENNWGQKGDRPHEEPHSESPAGEQ